MADNVAITAGAGTTVATDDVSGVHYQRVKLAVTTADDATGIGHKEDNAHASGDGGIMSLTVRKDTPAALADTDGDYQPPVTDAEGLTWVRPAPKTVRISVTPTISTSAYASGDVIGGQMTFANAVRKSGGSGIIQSICVQDVNPSIRAAMDLVFFDRSVTMAADNAVWNVSDADMKNCLGIVPIGAYNTAFPATILNAFSTLINVGLPIVLNGTDLYVGAIIRATPTYVGTSDLTFILTILQD